MEYELGIGGEVVPNQFSDVSDVAFEAAVPSVDEDFVNLGRVGSDGVWFGGVAGRSSGVGDLVGMFVSDGLVGSLVVLVVVAVVVFSVVLVINVVGFSFKFRNVIVVAFELGS